MVLLAFPALAWAAPEETVPAELEQAAPLAAAVPSMQALPLGGPFASPVVAVYVPPTRSERPIVATDSEVLWYDTKSGAWQRILELAPEQRPVLAVTAYAKSSQALYVAHASGIAVSRDGGAEWTSTEPPGYKGAEFVSLSVHPEDRKRAVVLVQGAAWMTGDSGRFWPMLELPGTTERSLDLEFTTVNGESRLVYATDRALYFSDIDFRNWTTLMRRNGGCVGATTAGSVAAILSDDGILTAFDLTRPGFRAQVGGLTGATALALDQGGFGICFAAIDQRIVAVSLDDADNIPQTLHQGVASVRGLVANPRTPNSLCWAEAGQVRTMQLDGDHFPAIPLSVASFQPGSTVPDVAVGGVESQSPVSEEAKTMLNDIIASQPPVEEVIAAALTFANYYPGEAEKWKANVRRKNLLPTLTLAAGQTERTVDRYDRVIDYDRFGVGSHEDLNKDDDIEYMDDYGVELRWNLSGFLFDRDQLMVSEETRKRSEHRNALVTQVSELYYGRIQLLVQERLAPPATLADATANQLRLRQMTSMLNEICGHPLFIDE